MNSEFFTNKGFIQILKFLVSGGISAALELGLLIGFVELFSLDYLVANILVFIIGGPINFLMNKYWVFEKGALNGYVQIAGFVLLALLNLVLNQFLLWVFVEFAHIDYKLSKVLAIGIAVILNFLVKKYLIFEKKKLNAKSPSLEFETIRDPLNKRK